MSEQPKHTVRVVLDGGMYPTMICPFDPADTSRPCWEHEESGERLAVSEMCVYKAWVAQDGPDAFGPAITLVFPLAAAHWDSDHFEFALGDPLASSRAERDAANARADQAIRFAAGVEEECARRTEALRRIDHGCEVSPDDPCTNYRDDTDDGSSVDYCVPCIVRAALHPITHDLPSDGRESDG